MQTAFSAGDGTTMFPCDKISGEWRIQTTDPAILRTLKRRCRNGQKWRQVGYAFNKISPDIFSANFSSLRDARAAFGLLVSTGKSKRLQRDSRAKTL